MSNFNDLDKLFNENGTLNKLDYRAGRFKAIWNDDLNGYEFNFTNVRKAQSQINIETDALDGKYGESYLERYTEYDEKLTKGQESKIEDFVSSFNDTKRKIENNVDKKDENSNVNGKTNKIHELLDKDGEPNKNNYKSDGLEAIWNELNEGYDFKIDGKDKGKANFEHAQNYETREFDPSILYLQSLSQDIKSNEEIKIREFIDDFSEIKSKLDGSPIKYKKNQVEVGLDDESFEGYNPIQNDLERIDNSMDSSKEKNKSNESNSKTDSPKIITEAIENSIEFNGKMEHKTLPPIESSIPNENKSNNVADFSKQSNNEKTTTDGYVLDFGESSNDKNEPSYFIKLKQLDDKEVTVWDSKFKDSIPKDIEKGEYIIIEQDNANIKLKESNDISTDKEQKITRGNVIGQGSAPYKFLENNTRSYFLTLKQLDDTEVTLWGKELPKNLEKGEYVAIKREDKIPVTVPVESVDENGLKSTSQIQTFRQEWKQIEADKISDKAGYNKVIEKIKAAEEKIKSASNIDPDIQTVKTDKESDDIFGDTNKHNPYINTQKEIDEAFSELKKPDIGLLIPSKDILKKYNVKENKSNTEYLSKGNSKDRLAVDHGSKIKTTSPSNESAKLLIDIAKEKNWSSIKVKGSKDFRRKLWLEAAKDGIEVTGFSPNEKDIEKLQKLNPNNYNIENLKPSQSALSKLINRASIEAIDNESLKTKEQKTDFVKGVMQAVLVKTGAITLKDREEPTINESEQEKKKEKAKEIER